MKYIINYKTRYAVLDTRRGRGHDVNGEKFLKPDFIGSLEACKEYKRKVNEYVRNN